MRTWILYAAIFLSSFPDASAQIGINPANSLPAASAGVDVDFTDRGFLQPRLTSEEIAGIPNPVAGLMVFNLSSGKPVYFDGITWRNFDGTANWSGCGDPLEVVHIAGSVAPVSKTVYYGTVTGIPGEPGKCWITSNLGADRQATAVSDATEASAGWYWQFNRKQGFNHPGTTVTPAWDITFIIENSDWLPANDPCTIELGAGWRIPTATEWGNVDASGPWTNWTGPWDSALKMHAAGFINEYNGSLDSRGTSGLYITTIQEDEYTCKTMYFTVGICELTQANKGHGLSVRCINP